MEEKIEKISATLKGGAGHDVPWIVLKAASVEEMAEDLAKVQALFADVAFLSKAFAEAFKSAPATAGEMVRNVLGAVPLTMEPVVQDAPWDNPPAPTAPAWAGGAPSSPFGGQAPVSNVYLIEVPRDKMEAWGPKDPNGKAIAGAGIRGQVQTELTKRGFDRKTLGWSDTDKRNTIKKDAPEDILAYIRSQGIELK